MIPVDYIPYGSEAITRIKKSCSYYRRILLIQKPKGTITYKSKMEKTVGATLNQGYVNRVTTVLKCCIIPPGNSDVLHRLILEKTRLGGGRIRTGTIKTTETILYI